MGSFPGETLDDFREIQLHDYLHVFAVTFLFYDHAITFDQEIEYLWNRPKGRSTYWFFANRYIAFLGNIAVLVLGFKTLSISSCKRFNTFRQILLLLNQLVVCILLTLRTYALYRCSKRVLVYMIGCAVLLLVPVLWTFFGQHIETSQSASGCHIAFSRKTSIRSAVAWEALLIYDANIFILTIVKTWKARHDHVVTGFSNPLISLIFRDGAIYFAVMVACNLANIMTYYFDGPFMAGGLSTFASSMSITMMSRLMLNLHRTADLGIMTTNHGSNNLTDHAYNSQWSGELSFVDPDTMHDPAEPEYRPQVGFVDLRRQLNIKPLQRQ